jgi:hypothetical protein
MSEFERCCVSSAISLTMVAILGLFGRNKVSLVLVKSGIGFPGDVGVVGHGY